MERLWCYGRGSGRHASNRSGKRDKERRGAASYAHAHAKPKQAPSSGGRVEKLEWFFNKHGAPVPRASVEKPGGYFNKHARWKIDGSDKSLGRGMQTGAPKSTCFRSLHNMDDPAYHDPVDQFMNGFEVL